MANSVDIIIKAIDQTGGTFSKVNAGFKSLTGFSLGAAGGLALAGKAIKEIGDYIDASIDKMDAYTSSIVDEARVFGMATDEYSRFVQVADDVFLSQEKLKAGFQAAARQGIDVSLEGIKKLSVQYRSLSTDQERAAFTAKNFGRNGLEMYKVLEMDSASLDKAMAAISDNLVVTEQSIEVVYAYKRAKDAATDAEDAFAYSVAQGTMPAVTDLNNQYADMLEAVNESGAATKVLSTLSNGLRQALLGVKVIFGGYTTEAEAAEQATKRLSGEQVELVGELGNVTQYFKALTTEMLFNKIAQNMTEEAALSLSVQMGLLNPQTYSLMLATEELTAKYDTNQNGVIGLTEMTAEYRAEVDRLKASVDSLEDKTVTITFDTVYNNSGSNNIGQAEIAANYDLNGNGIIGAHNGLSGVVPPGYPNDSFGPVYMESGEGVDIIPASEMRSGRSGGSNVNLNITITGNTMLGESRTMTKELARMLKPELDRIVGIA